MVHEAGFAQSRGVSKHFNGSAVIPVPVENLPAMAEQFLFFDFFNWHYTERSYGKSTPGVCSSASICKNIFPEQPEIKSAAGFSSGIKIAKIAPAGGHIRSLAPENQQT